MPVLECLDQVAFLDVEITNSSDFHVCASTSSVLLLRVSDGEFHPANKGCLEHGDEHLAVLQPACRAHERPEVEHREIQPDARGCCALLQAHQVGQVLLQLHWLPRP